MKIEHLAILVSDLEKMRNFYEQYFGANANDKYMNEKKGFSSYFLSFSDGPRLELMHRNDISNANNESLGFAHVAFSLGSKERVDELTNRFKNDGFIVLGEPRITGDGYYESVIKDPEGNLVELTI